MQDIKSLILVTIFIFFPQFQSSVASDTSSLFDSSSVQDIVNNIYDEEVSSNSMENCFARTKTLSSTLMRNKLQTILQSSRWIAELFSPDWGQNVTDAEMNDALIWNYCLIDQSFMSSGTICKDSIRKKVNDKILHLYSSKKNTGNVHSNMLMEASTTTACKTWQNLDYYGIPTVFNWMQTALVKSSDGDKHSYESNQARGISIYSNDESFVSRGMESMSYMSKNMQNIPFLKLLPLGLSFLSLFFSLALSSRINSAPPGPTGPIGPVGRDGPTGLPAPATTTTTTETTRPTKPDRYNSRELRKYRILYGI